MRPISVRFRCFGPYMDEQYVDFTQLDKLFLISGETGAGKTTILDAICYALYGKSSGGLRGDLSVMRCQLAKKEDTTEVEFIFDNKGVEYKFTRRLYYGRKNLNEEDNYLCRQQDGSWISPLANPKPTYVNRAAEEIIGLSYEQFRQVIILPQGQFEKLLVSSSDEKEKILVTLFHADQWERISSLLREKYVSEDRELKNESDRIHTKLQEFECNSIEALQEKEFSDMACLQNIEKDFAKADEQFKTIESKCKTALIEHQQFKQLHEYEKKLTELLNRKADYDLQEDFLSRADRAEKLRKPYEDYQVSAENVSSLQNKLSKAEEDLQSSRDAHNKALKDDESHKQSIPENEKLKEKVILLKKTTPIYTNLDELRKNLVTAQKALNQITFKATEATNIFNNFHQAWLDAMKEQSLAAKAYISAQEAYTSNICGKLASDLEKGIPCPVCGSTEHPFPAVFSGERISEDDLEDLNQKQNSLSEKVSSAKEERDKAEKDKCDAETQQQEAKQSLLSAQNNYDNASSQLIPGIQDTEALMAEINLLQNKINRFEAEGSTLSEAFKTAAKELSRQEEIHRRATDDLKEAEEKKAFALEIWKNLFAESGFETEQHFAEALTAPETVLQKRKEITEFRTQLSSAKDMLAEQQEKLLQKTEPDMNALEEEKSLADKRLKDLQENITLRKKDLESLKNTLTELSDRTAKYEIRRKEADANLEFSKRLIGSSGVSLQRYVLGVMLSSITVSANRLLQNVYAGRYQLFRSDEIAGSGRKSGLELDVFDRVNNEKRSVTTLSGGEKFLVSLCLAIGLSSIVQSRGSGIRMEAMFIDEGFGSLDPAAANDAIDVLKSVQSGNGIVGIISHVEQLESTISCKIEAKKGKNGSQLIIHS